MIVTLHYLHQLWLAFAVLMQDLLAFFSTKWSTIADNLRDGGLFGGLFATFIDVFVELIGDYTMLEFIFTFGLGVFLAIGMIRFISDIAD